MKKAKYDDVPLWIARTPYLLLNSPYLLHPSPRYLLDDNLPLVLSLDYLTGEEYNQELLETHAGKDLLTYRQLVAGEFLRQCIATYRHFPHWKASEEMKPLLDLELKLWITNFRMLRRLHELHLLVTEPHFAILFGALIAERKLMVLISVCSDGQIAIKNYIGALQSQNRKLQGCENPFDREETPQTWEVLNQAISIADRDDDFRREFYMPMVRARQKFVTFMKEERFRGYFQGKLQRQGRRKQTKS